VGLGGVFRLYLPQTQSYLDKTWNVSEGPWCTLTQEKMGEIAPKVPPKGAKTCFVLFLSPTQSGLSATYPAPILSIFEIKDVIRFSHAYTGEKFLNFCAGRFPGPKTAKMGTFDGGACEQGGGNGTISGDGNYFGS